MRACRSTVACLPMCLLRRKTRAWCASWSLQRMPWRRGRRREPSLPNEMFFLYWMLMRYVLSTVLMTSTRSLGMSHLSVYVTSLGPTCLARRYAMWRSVSSTTRVRRAASTSTTVSCAMAGATTARLCCQAAISMARCACWCFSFSVRTAFCSGGPGACTRVIILPWIPFLPRHTRPMPCTILLTLSTTPVVGLSASPSAPLQHPHVKPARPSQPPSLAPSQGSSTRPANPAVRPNTKSLWARYSASITVCGRSVKRRSVSWSDSQPSRWSGIMAITVPVMRLNTPMIWPSAVKP
mmetsp:Transcript_34475/g.76602  ORF Transcript_34475/g.76602 Transcript_34475/m.76602 type:complete len:295 (-) Transcript_34475:2753-3637(-)